MKDIFVAGAARGEGAGAKEVVDLFKEAVEAGINVVDVGYDGNSRFTGPAGGGCSSGSIVAIDEQGAGASDPSAIEVGGEEGDTRLAPPENGALGGAIEKDVGELACAAGGGDPVSFNPCALELAALEFGGIIFANFADVASFEAPGLACGHGAGDLSSGEARGAANLNLGIASGEVRELDQGVGSVEAYAGDVCERDFGGRLCRHGATVAKIGGFSRGGKEERRCPIIFPGRRDET